MASVVWAAVALLFFIAVFVVGGLDPLFLGIAAVLAAGVGLLAPGAWWLQVLVFAVGGFAALGFFRRRFKSLFRGEELRLPGDEHAGQSAKVIEAIEPGGEGRISFHGTSWAAYAYDERIPVGAGVTILAQEEARFLVTARPLDGSDRAGQQP